MLAQVKQQLRTLSSMLAAATRGCAPEYSLSYMLGCAGLYLAMRKVLQATVPLLAVADTAQLKSPTRVSCITEPNTPDAGPTEELQRYLKHRWYLETYSVLDIAGQKSCCSDIC